jgi:hypothetical protein
MIGCVTRLRSEESSGTLHVRFARRFRPVGRRRPFDPHSYVRKACRNKSCFISRLYLSPQCERAKDVHPIGRSTGRRSGPERVGAARRGRRAVTPGGGSRCFWDRVSMPFRNSRAPATRNDQRRFRPIRTTRSAFNNASAAEHARNARTLGDGGGLPDCDRDPKDHTPGERQEKYQNAGQRTVWSGEQGDARNGRQEQVTEGGDAGAGRTAIHLQ